MRQPRAVFYWQEMKLLAYLCLKQRNPRRQPCKQGEQQRGNGQNQEKGHVRERIAGSFPQIAVAVPEGNCYAAEKQRNVNGQQCKAENAAVCVKARKNNRHGKQDGIGLNIPVIGLWLVQQVVFCNADKKQGEEKQL